MIQLAKPRVAGMQMQGPLYKAPPPLAQQPGLASQFKQRALQSALNQSEKQLKKKLLEKAEAETIGAAGAAMGDPTGGIATEVAYEAAAPMIKGLIGGFFSKGGFVNGPLSRNYFK